MHNIDEASMKAGAQLRTLKAERVPAPSPCHVKQQSLPLMHMQPLPQNMHFSV